jgi:zinc protease
MKKTTCLLFILFALLLTGCNSVKKESTLSVPFEKYSLSNGLTVVLNIDKSDPIACVAIYYHVGSSREVPGKTGFAHLFEHMMFQRSENVGEDQLFKMIQKAGGTLNGGTSLDQTVYYEVVPKNALEMVLWLESDRMGYLENTVTRAAFINQQNVVQNEKRQNYDNQPYGYQRMVLAKNIYPKGHPYSWLTIGEMQDLANATVDDVKAFHHKFYTPTNATLVVSGDIDPVEIKPVIEKYFGEIPAGEKFEERKAMPVTLTETKKIFHEDNLAKTPQFTMVFPTVEQYSKDSYALNYLGELLAGSKKSPLYKILVEEKKLTSRVSAYNGSNELAGTFSISVPANPGVNLTEVEKAIFEGFKKFETDGFSEEDLNRIKAQNETGFYGNFSSIMGKAFTLGAYQMYKGDPGFYQKDFDETQAVTLSDIKSVYDKYIKGKNYVATSFVPKGQASLVDEGSVNAGIVEEDVSKATEQKEEKVAGEPIVKTKTILDRSIAPVPGPDPGITVPPVWTGSLSDGVRIWGIVNKELPLIQYQLVIDGGHLLDTPDKAGTASFLASMLNEGTRDKTPEQLEDAIGLLGANISVYSGTENTVISVSTLERNFEKTLALVEEILLQPRWDEKQFPIVKSRIINSIKRNMASPTYLASSTLNSLIFGKDNILSVQGSGTIESVNMITMDDLKKMYDESFSPSVSRFLIVGDIEKERVEKALVSLNDRWTAKEVKAPVVKTIPAPEKAQLYFIDIPDAKQSAIYIGCPSVTRLDPDYYPLSVLNTKLGGDFNSVFNMILREEKGYTYGARSGFSANRFSGSFVASTTVITKATEESVDIFKTEMEKYRSAMPQDFIDYTKDALLKSNARRFETLGSLLSMIYTISTFNLPADYVKQEEYFVKNYSVDKAIDLARKYIDPAKMYYVVAGDAKTQLKPLEKLGLGKPILIKD